MFFGLTAFVGVQVLAQPSAPDLSGTFTTPLGLRNPPVVSPAQLQASPRSAGAVALGSKYQLTGPLVRPFTGLRTRGFWSLPLRLLQAVNPFAAKRVDDDTGHAAGLSTRAWSTLVGWHPGASAFSDPVTHEPAMDLISVGRNSPP